MQIRKISFVTKENCEKRSVRLIETPLKFNKAKSYLDIPLNKQSDIAGMHTILLEGAKTRTKKRG
jgi:hypothetical protein